MDCNNAMDQLGHTTWLLGRTRLSMERLASKLDDDPVARGMIELHSETLEKVREDLQDYRSRRE